MVTCVMFAFSLALYSLVSLSLIIDSYLVCVNCVVQIIFILSEYLYHGIWMCSTNYIILIFVITQDMAKHTERLPTLPHPPVSRAAKKHLSLHRPASELHK